MSEVLHALEDMSTQAKLEGVTSRRFVVIGSIDSFQAGFAGFSVRLDKHEVPFKGLWTTVLDQRNYFYGGDACFLKNFEPLAIHDVAGVGASVI